MKRFVSTELFRILRKILQEGIDMDSQVLEKEYNRFVVLLLADTALSQDRAAYRNSFAYTLLRLAGLTVVSGKNAAFSCQGNQFIDEQTGWMERQTFSERNAVICPFRQESESTKKLQLECGVTELVELAYTLHEAGCFGNATLKTAFTVIGKAFGCETANYYRLFWDARNRINNDRAYFLNKLRQALSNKLIHMDGGARS